MGLYPDFYSILYGKSGSACPITHDRRSNYLQFENIIFLSKGHERHERTHEEDERPENVAEPGNVADTKCFSDNFYES